MSCSNCDCEDMIESKLNDFEDDLNYGSKKVLRAEDLVDLITVLDVLVANAKFMTPEALKALKRLKGEYV